VKNQKSNADATALEVLINACLESLGIDADKIAQWKKEHRTDVLHQIYVYTTPEKTAVAVGFLKSADRIITGRAMSLYSAGEQLEANDLVLANCWVGGAECLLTEDKLRIAASVQAGACIEILEGGVKKV
jgi:hypothetical protein